MSISLTGNWELGTGHSIQAPFELSGVGLHTGTQTQVRVLPAARHEGRYFVRVDLAGSPVIPARVEFVRQTTLSTELGNEDACVRTVEHLLAALAAQGVDSARIEINGPEVPLLDGSAHPWVEAINSVGVVSENDPTSIPNTRILKEPVWVHQGDAFVAALPAPQTRFTYGIDFDLPAIGQQWYSWTPATERFAAEIAPARTFGFAAQIEQLRSQGLIKGGSLDNALVCDVSGWLNPPLRFANEPVRHKILDLVGDISLLGAFPSAHFLAYKASHKLHIQLARLLAQSHSGF
ncbi:UDP-3-O-acyl-N-acetylglucosamine deacetylase [Microcoleus sp. FACHB-68]|uniref:UDP-3-O-acyl-N-acetylglucosamine deacetylase n=1 Tax=Microcoleus sp. FACHB-68 TaxID=2692826 RepID=UPI0016889E82|nr:UDP-3-O-acyl-N-acetylglucosamine deacetylase [Microcoleus sp. FACHB-68]MBD1938743.1 UDP-3-O-acyl-N-acetylglucosamine deacetylase [Microcoleus sp. FACHB-68]